LKSLAAVRRCTLQNLSSKDKEYETEMVRSIEMAMKKEMEIGRAGGRWREGKTD
jgi:hypothetical protein